MQTGVKGQITPLRLVTTTLLVAWLVDQAAGRVDTPKCQGHQSETYEWINGFCYVTSRAAALLLVLSRKGA